jgi:hypothetical protein
MISNMSVFPCIDKKFRKLKEDFLSEYKPNLLRRTLTVGTTNPNATQSKDMVTHSYGGHISNHLSAPDVCNLEITFLIPTIRGVMGDVDFFGHDATVLRREVVGTFSFGINKACCALDGPRSTDPPAARISP